MEKISYDDFAKLDLRIGKIIKVEDHPSASRLLILTVNFGDEKRTIVAGLKEHYEKKELEGKKAVFITNLEPRTLKGVESNGMILAASTEDKSKVVILEPEKDLPEGSKIS